jgi:WD40 repeat protein/serine/threonine protein kinase
MAIDEKAIFVAALALPAAKEREAYLREACAGNPELVGRLRELLSAHEESQGPLDRGPALFGATLGAADTERPGAIIGPYKLIEQIGEGGMGTVWMAQQTEPVKRLVAVKLIKAGMDSKQVIARFEAERQALALMDHPNIARVLDGGTTKGEPGGVSSGRPYFVMDLVKGVPITKYCDEHHLTPRQRLELFIPVCQAIQHAHQKGIIHRDLKPSNVVVALYDGKPVPKVIDFGVAKAAGQTLTDKTLVTGFGSIIGTLEYMSPEQAEINQIDIDTRSDIYSLGVLLYELLTGSPPFTKKDLEKTGMLEMLRVIREKEATKPSTKLSTAEGLPTLAANRGTEPAKLSKLLRGELDWIVMKALEKDRNRRYETANSFAMDLQRYLVDEPVQACPPSAGYRLRKFVRRNKVAVATAAAVVLVVVLAVLGLATSTLLIAREQQATAKALEGETQAKEALRHDTYFHRIALAHRELSMDNLGRALQFLDECPKELRGWEWHYLMRLCGMEPMVLRDKTEVNSLAFSPDGEFLASAGGDGAIKVWRVGTRKMIRTLEKAHGGFACSVAFHPDGTHLASVGADQLVKVWDWRTGRKVFDCHCEGVHAHLSAHAAVFNPRDDRQLAVGSDGDVTVWDWRNRQVLHHLAGQEKIPLSLAFSRDGRRLASGNWRGIVRLWDAEAGGEPLWSFSETPNPVGGLAFNKNGDLLATASFGRRVDVWDTTTGQRVCALPHTTGLVLGVAFSPDGSRLASAGEDKIVRIWDTATWREVLGLRGHTGVCGCLAFSPDGHRLASASQDKTIRIWDATPLQGGEGQETPTWQYRNEVWSLALSPDGQKIASAGWSMPLEVRDAHTGQGAVEFAGHKTIVFCVAWQPDGKRIATAGGDGPMFSVKVWDAQTRRPVFTVPEHPGGTEFNAVAFSLDGKYLVTGNKNGAVQVWNAENGQKVGALGAHDREIRGVVFSPDGLHLASTSGDGRVKVWTWNLTRPGQMQKPEFECQAWVPGAYLNVAFSPDGGRLVTGGQGNTVKIWDVQTGQELKTLYGHTGDVCAMAFSPDGRWLATAGEDSTIRIWDATSWKLRHTLRGHVGIVSTLSFIPQSQRLVSGSRDHTVKVWDVAQLDEVSER